MKVKKAINKILLKLGYQLTKSSSIEAYEKTKVDYRYVLGLLEKNEKKLNDLELQTQISSDQKERIVTREKITRDSREAHQKSLRVQVLKNNGFKLNSAVNYCSFDENWEKPFKKVFGEAHFFSLGYNDETETIRQKNLELRKDVRSQNASECNHDEKISLGEFNNSEIVKKKLDGLLQELEISPQLLIFDAAVFDSKTLAGATESLKKAEMCIIRIEMTETVSISENSSKLIIEHGYVLYDIWDLKYRTIDNSMSSCELVYIKPESIVLSECI